MDDNKMVLVPRFYLLSTNQPEIRSSDKYLRFSMGRPANIGLMGIDLEYVWGNPLGILDLQGTHLFLERVHLLLKDVSSIILGYCMEYS